MEISRKLEKSIMAPNKSHSLWEQKYLKIIHLGSEAEENFELLFEVKYWYIVINKTKILFLC